MGDYSWDILELKRRKREIKRLLDHPKNEEQVLTLLRSYTCYRDMLLTTKSHPSARFSKFCSSFQEPTLLKRKILSKETPYFVEFSPDEIYYFYSIANRLIELPYLIQQKEEPYLEVEEIMEFTKKILLELPFPKMRDELLEYYERPNHIHLGKKEDYLGKTHYGICYHDPYYKDNFVWVSNCHNLRTCSTLVHEMTHQYITTQKDYNLNRNPGMIREDVTQAMETISMIELAKMEIYPEIAKEYIDLISYQNLVVSAFRFCSLWKPIIERTDCLLSLPYLIKLQEFKESLLACLWIEDYQKDGKETLERMDHYFLRKVDQDDLSTFSSFGFTKDRIYTFQKKLFKKFES